MGAFRIAASVVYAAPLFALCACAGSAGGASPAVAPGVALAAHATKAAGLRNDPGNYNVLYLFQGAAKGDGANSYASLIAVNGTLYGTTSAGGNYNKGTIFSITPAGSESVLYNFTGGADGGNPYAGLIDVNGTLYGTTRAGGSSGLGTVFSYKLGAPSDETVICNFTGSSTGAVPYGGLVALNGALYGTTLYGGSNNLGTVFKIAKSGSESIVYSFTGGSDGQNPYAGLLNVSGTLYGTTYGGGSSGEGTVFAVAPNGNETVVHSFSGAPGDGAFPVAGLINAGGTLYGTTSSGGTNNFGTVYSLSQNGSENVTYSFAGAPSDGQYPAAALTNVTGTLYGTTSAGGKANMGTIFKIPASGSESIVHNFGGGTDGGDPYAALTPAGGLLYGTTHDAGSGCNGSGCGTVFTILGKVKSGERY